MPCRSMMPYGHFDQPHWPGATGAIANHRPVFFGPLRDLDIGAKEAPFFASRINRLCIFRVLSIISGRRLVAAVTPI